MKTKAQRCWWCNKKLALPHYATVISDTGDRLKVHKQCEAKAERFWEPIKTALRRGLVYSNRSA